MCNSVVWRWAAFAAVLATHRAHGEEAAGSVRGVSPSDQAKYAGSAKGAQTFRCFGGAVSGSLPFAAVNDNFCDCADGSDEPGTSACAGQKDTLFYCRNEQSTPSFIYTSHLNDGICDCCDGSDEWSRLRPSPCPNTCPEEGKRLRKELAEREAVWKKGNAKRLKLLEAARAELEQAKKDIVTLNVELSSLEAAENTTATALKEAQLVLDAERQEAKGNQTKETERKEEAEEKAPAAEKAEEQADKAKEQSEEGEKVVSEYTKWMDGADKALGSTGTVSKSAAPVEEAVEDSGDDLDNEASGEEEEGLESEEEFEEKKEVSEKGPGLLDRFLSFNRRVWKSFWGRITGKIKDKTPAEIAQEDADKAHKDAKKKLEDAKKRLKALDKKVNANHTEEQLAFSALDGRCIKKTLAEYEYEVCFFKEAKQSSTSIGNWERWEGSSVALFDNGQYCPGGPSRSLRVRFQCGETEEILDVTEPSRCTYEASMSHPGACSGVLPSEAQQGRIRMPSDEL